MTGKQTTDADRDIHGFFFFSSEYSRATVVEVTGYVLIMRVYLGTRKAVARSCFVVYTRLFLFICLARSSRGLNEETIKCWLLQPSLGGNSNFLSVDSGNEISLKIKTSTQNNETTRRMQEMDIDWK